MNKWVKIAGSCVVALTIIVVGGLINNTENELQLQTPNDTLSAELSSSQPEEIENVPIEIVNNNAYELIDSTDPIEVIEGLFKYSYEGYTRLEAYDMSDFYTNIDSTMLETLLGDRAMPEEVVESMGSFSSNSIIGYETLIQRRAILSEENLSYVDQELYDYEITVEDEFYEGGGFWRIWEEHEGYETYFFTITGETEGIYPPFLALNSQQAIVLKEMDDGSYKIAMHYYTGVASAVLRVNPLQLKTNEAHLEEILTSEFTGTETELIQVPVSAKEYQADIAVEYALTYLIDSNPTYYKVPDSMGNCQNYVSQSLLSGFEGNGASMTNQWYAGGGGGSPAWENVDYFWSWAVENSGIGGTIIENSAQLQNGDIIQVRSRDTTSDDDGYGHVLIVVDEEKGVLAQNSPGALMYYSDLWNKDIRIFRPQFMY